MKARASLPIIALAIAGCGGSTSGLPGGNNANYLSPERAKYVTETATRDLKSAMATKVVAAMNGFSFDLFESLKPGDKNACISPVSLGSAFAMVYNGANGATKDGMTKALQTKGIDEKDANAAYKNLTDLLKAADPKVEVTIANAIWTQTGQEFDKTFLETNQNYYNANIGTLNFADPESVDTVNEWVKANTKNKIPTLVDKFGEGTRMYLANAVYFKGLWQKPFEKKDIKTGDFTKADGKKVKAEMMGQSGAIKAFSTPKASGVSLPYGSGRLEMVLVLPKAGTKNDEFLKSLNEKTWSEWVAALAPKPIALKMPKWKSEYKASLSEPLKALGMTAAFDPAKADFSKMRKQKDLFISDAVHKTFIEVDEEGTEAAAATGVEMQTTSAPAFEDFVLDRPFFYAVRDSQTGAILFLGFVADPS